MLSFTKYVGEGEVSHMKMKMLLLVSSHAHVFE